MNLGALRPVTDITLLYRFLKVAAIFCPTLVYFIVAQVPAANPREEKNAMSAISQSSRPLLEDGVRQVRTLWLPSTGATLKEPLSETHSPKEGPSGKKLASKFSQVKSEFFQRRIKQLSCRLSLNVTINPYKSYSSS